jgi:hypothetical protein
MIPTRNFFIANPFQGIENGPSGCGPAGPDGGVGVFLEPGEERVLRPESRIVIRRIGGITVGTHQRAASRK